MKKERVVITGMGVVTPVGLGIGETFDALVQKQCGIARITAFDPSRFAAQIAGEVKAAPIQDCVPKGYRKAVKVMARDIVLAVMAAYYAVRDARLKTKCVLERGEETGEPDVAPTRFGANIGAGLICADLNELAGALASVAERPEAATDRGFSMTRWGSEGMQNLTPLWLLKFLPNMLACHVTIVHDCQAPSNTITCGEASSHLAIGEAFRTLERGDADVCVCGGAESKLNPMGLMRQELMGRLVTDCNDRPEAACRPFDVSRGGMVIAEGGGLMILERLEHAQRRGARIYGEVIGFGAAASARHWLTPDPDGRALALAASKALGDAGIRPEEIDLINPFGVGTPADDAAEAAAIRRVFGARAGSIPVLATKGSLGNCGAGSGAIDLAVGVMALHRRVIPPCVTTRQVDPACGLRVICGDPIDSRAETMLSLARALCGGQTAALVIRRTQA